MALEHPIVGRPGEVPRSERARGVCVSCILAILFPITAFVTLGFEHSIANWFFLPFGIALDTGGSVPFLGAARNLVAATAGNLVGGTLLVAGVYWVAYLRGDLKRAAGPERPC